MGAITNGRAGYADNVEVRALSRPVYSENLINRSGGQSLSVRHHRL